MAFFNRRPFFFQFFLNFSLIFSAEIGLWKNGTPSPQEESSKVQWISLRTQTRNSSLEELRRQNSKLQPIHSPQPNFEEIYSSKVNGVEILENDIIINRSTPFHLENANRIQHKNFLINPRYHWPTNIIPVILDPNAPYNRKERALILSALSQYHLHTCIRFVPRTTETDFVFITHDPMRGCSSNVGRQGGQQTMYLRIPGCVTLIGTAIHEMLHNLGFFHEHSRPDRDSNIRVIWSEITPGYESNFNAYPSSILETLGQPYDFDSVMQYSAVAFSRDQSSYTIYPLNVDPKRLGQRLKFSDTDIRKVNVAYKCGDIRKDDDVEENSVTIRPNQPVPTINSPAVCYSEGPIDAGVMNSHGDLHIFKKGYYWTFKETSPGKFSATHAKARIVAKQLNGFLPKTLDTVATLDDHYYFFSNDAVNVLTTLDNQAVMDFVPMNKIFKPVNFNVRGFFQLENQHFISNGSSVFQYNPLNDAVLGQVNFSASSGLPSQYDNIFGISNGRLLIIKGSQVYITKPHLLTAENGYPRSFHSVFC